MDFRRYLSSAIDSVGVRRYLVQDYASVGTLAPVVGHAAGQAPTMEPRGRLAGFGTAFAAVLGVAVLGLVVNYGRGRLDGARSA